MSSRAFLTLGIYRSSVDEVLYVAADAILMPTQIKDSLSYLRKRNEDQANQWVAFTQSSLALIYTLVSDEFEAYVITLSKYITFFPIVVEDDGSKWRVIGIPEGDLRKSGV